jgi:hypothetical protein
MSREFFLEYERKRWLRHDAHRFIRSDWRRFVKRGSELAAYYELIERKFNSNQPRVPAGSSEGGRWAGGGGQTAQSTRVQYSRFKPGYHHYRSGPNVVCPAAIQCSREEIADQLARYSVPGQDPAKPVESGGIYPVHEPNTGVYVGDVTTTITDNGLTVTNRTQEGHIFHDGIVTRRATQAADGSWQVTTEGIGNSVTPGMEVPNAIFGPGIFNSFDKQIRVNIERHHTKGHNAAYECGTHPRRDRVFRRGLEGEVYVAS